MGAALQSRRDGQPRIGSHPILRDSNPKLRLDSSLSTLGPAMGSTGQNNPLILTKNAGIHRTSSDIIRIALQFFKDV